MERIFAGYCPWCNKKMYDEDVCKNCNDDPQTYSEIPRQVQDKNKNFNQNKNKSSEQSWENRKKPIQNKDDINELKEKLVETIEDLKNLKRSSSETSEEVRKLKASSAD